MLLLGSALATPHTLVAPTFPDRDEVHLQVRAGNGDRAVAEARLGLSGYYGAVDFSLGWMPTLGLANVTSLRGPELPLGPGDAVCSPYLAVVGFWAADDDWFELLGWSAAAGLALHWARGPLTVDAAIPAVGLTLVDADFGPGNWKLWAWNSELAVGLHRGPLSLVAGAAATYPTAAARLSLRGWSVELRQTGWPERGFTLTAGLGWRHDADTTWMMPEESR